MDKQNERRWAKLEVSTEFLAEFLRGQARPVVATNAPKDLRVLCVDQPKAGMIQGTVDIYVESEEFTPVAEGAAPPVVTFWYKHYVDDELV